MGTILGLFASPLVRVGLLALGVVAVVGYLRYDAAEDARREAEIEFRKAAEEQVEREVSRQREAAQRAVGAAEAQAERMKAERDALHEKVNHIIRRLRSEPDASCRISDDLARELHTIE